MQNLQEITIFVIGAFLAFGVGALQMSREHPKDFLMARVSFWGSGLILAAAVYWWLCQQHVTVTVFTGITVALAVGIGLVTGALLKWVNEREAAPSEFDRQASLTKIRDLILSSAKRPLPERVDVIGALIQFSYEFKSEENVVWICTELEQRQFQNPFKILESAAPGIFEGRKLEFLKDARTAKSDIHNITSARSFIATRWHRSDEFKKAYHAHLAIPVETESGSPVPYQLEINPRLDALANLKSVRDGGDLMLDTFRTMGVSGKRPTAEQVEACIIQMVALVKAKALEVTPAEFAMFEALWPQQDLYAITKKLAVDGCFSGNESEIFGRLWDRVERLKQLIYTIENKG